MPDVDAPRRSQHLRAARQRLSLRRGAEVLREADSRRARGLARTEDDRRQAPAMAERPDGRRTRLPLRPAFHARRHPALLLGRFRQPGRPAAGSREHQRSGVAQARRRTAVGDGVGLSTTSLRAERSNPCRRVTRDGLLRRFAPRNDEESPGQFSCRRYIASTI